MNAFETWASGVLDYEDIQEAIHFRERHVALILPPEELRARWKRDGYTPPRTGGLQLTIPL